MEMSRERSSLVAGYLQRNNLIDTSIQKAGISGIWHQIQVTKKEGADLHVVFLDLASAWVPPALTTLVKAYFQDIQLCVTTAEFTTAWQHLELLGKLHENIKLARLKIKPSKSRSISIVQRKLTHHCFHIGKEPIPMVSEKPLKSLGCWYDVSLKGKEQVEQLRKEVASGLETSKEPCFLAS
ncbi:uncharacterized protein LOC124385259 [Xyrichtys novacula]|uniref:Uncharacterized protein LOC124385259 n=1 Tax=Xyrichtys novacula TaxID=13765 RepID=A0AAV1F9U3_XYRNO|nr:uncharacterized protein LOC124385259 [Xyrichtys novacula]